VFVPRVRSELLVRLAAEAAERTSGTTKAGTTEAGTTEAGTTGQAPAPVIVDLCCGSGALGAAVAGRVPGVDLHAADVAADAVACARDNLSGIGARVYDGDLFAALPGDLLGRIDVLLANVPYVPTAHLALLPAEARLHEPREALDGGSDGLEVLRAVAAEAPRWLAPGGVLLSEVTEAQVPSAAAALRGAGLRAEVVRDGDLEATVMCGHAG
jgi:release factor glutamine methyltransferase